jgi:phage recombination protein Bet
MTETKAQNGQPPQQTSALVAEMAAHYKLEPAQFRSTLMQTVMPSGGKATVEQVYAFLVVAQKHGLNPFTREIYAFPDSKSGGIRPIVSIDGWYRIVNDNPAYDGCRFTENITADGECLSVTCSIFRKDRAHPIEVTEYMSECKRNTEPWKQWPVRMLRHKAFIQCARAAFSFSGIVEPDEAEREIEATGSVVEITPQPGEGRLTALVRARTHAKQKPTVEPSSVSGDPGASQADPDEDDGGDLLGTTPFPDATEDPG